MAVDAWHRKGGAPEIRIILEGPRRDLVQHLRFDADIGDAHMAAMHPARQQQMRRLLAEEGDGLGGIHRRAHHGCAGAVDAARQVDREHRGAVGVDRFDHRVRLAVDRATEARAEQRIDDQRGLSDRLRIERQHRVLPAARRGGRVTLELVSLAHQDHRDVAPLRGELGGCDKTVAAIVAGTSHDQDRPLLHQRIGGLRDRLSRAEHQLEAGRACRNTELVGTLHFSVGQNFHATSLVQTPLQQARSVPTHPAEQRFAQILNRLPIS
ncbi:hypothetical protein AB7M63_003535 [Bradyrhizobium japonicum]